MPQHSLQPNRRLSIAPMMDYTDRLFRYFARLISRHTLLYTEMITTGALLHGDAERFLEFDVSEHPVAIQLGGSNPAELAEAARLAETAGYDEVNLNVGCPSDRVQNGMIGACLMAHPELVADCVRAMKEAVSIPVTVKTRIGIDDNDSYAALQGFVAAQIGAGCDHFIIHARKAWLQGLSPKENREVPPLRYEIVQQLKQDFPEMGFTINGGIQTLTLAEQLLQGLDGVMIGREAYHNPWILAEADRRIYGDNQPQLSRHQVLERFMPFVEQQLQRGIPLNRITRHILGLFHGCPGARAWRRLLSEQAHQPGAGAALIAEAAALVHGSN
ncbi:tRNA dihydrouridine(20/20a) synthase DusA [endosymbiont of Riftia pachyptila]|uniref:tRNA-dihydrouridine(20/20a) synthase n=1 Tax=endosymbiont of Riftia pachyptila (vent Ph05) TaxID=1048808 RepID=G2DGL2_9GAMM|nr:tRNA dihydrouridine(20/20a) synthase DusA [endosymbiont of Riftia pachyptila]EGV50230.1 tRNA-dihydrouridine synthase A [endosymbiont of Riftia pachyptila (vent Ph05)]